MIHKSTSYLLKKWIVLGIVFGMLVATSMISAGASNAAASDNGVDAFKKKLDEQVPKWQSRYDVPGVAIGIVHDGKIAYTLNYGYADKQIKKALSDSTIFQAGSISKSLTAWGILHLASQGSLSLDDPVGKFLTRWSLPPSEFNHEEVTIRRLLSHTAGLPAHKGYLGVAPGNPLSSIEQSLSGEQWKMAYKPGTEAAYSGAGYSLLQLVIEEVTGMSFENYMEENVLKPLGMKSSSFRQQPASPDLAKAYGYFGQLLPNYQFTEMAAAGFQTNTTDMMAFILASMEGTNGERKGRSVISSEQVNTMQTPVIGENGLGIFVRKLSDRRSLMYHSGDNRGWHSFYGWIHDSQDGLVILTNSENGVDLRQDIYHLWVEYQTGTMPASYFSLSQQRSTNAAIAVTLAVLLGFYILLAAIGWIRGKRVIITKHATRPYLKFLLRTIFLSLVSTILFIVSYKWSIVSLHSNNKVSMLLLFAWLITLMIAGLFPKKLKTKK